MKTLKKVLSVFLSFIVFYFPLTGSFKQLSTASASIEVSGNYIDEFHYINQREITIELWIGKLQALVNNNPIALDTPPIIYNGRTLVPVRFIAEAFGADIFFDAKEQEINIAFGPTYISLWINKTRALIETTENGEKKNRTVTLDTPPIIYNGRTLVPVRFIAEAFGATIDWNAREEKITIKLLVQEKESNTRGNSVGNIVNHGWAAQQGDWLYYRSNDARKLYKIRTDGTGRTKLTDDQCYFLNVVGGWVYYQHARYPEFNLYKIRTDGTGRTKLNDDASDYINVVGDWIYFKNRSDGGKLYKIRTDGKGRTKLNEESSDYLNVVGDWIYYNGNGREIYKIRTDGTRRTKLTDDNSWFLNVVGDWIYYQYMNVEDTSDVGKMYKIRTDGTGRTKLTDEFSGDINVAGDWIYYIGKGTIIYKIRTDGTGRTKLNEDKSSHITVLGEWVYYLNGNDYDRLYKIRTDGTERQLVE